MKIEKISENQIRCTLNSNDLTDRQLNLGELAYGSTKARNLFREMMQQAFNDFGFDAEDNPLMVEAIPLSTDSIMLIITKVDDPEELDTRFAKFSPGSEEDGAGDDPSIPFTLEGASAPDLAAPSDEPKEASSSEDLRIFHFRSLDHVSQAAEVLEASFDGHNSLYRNPATKEYFLVISRQGYKEDEFARVLNTLSEFGSRIKGTYASEAYYQEHFDLIIEGLALQILKAV
ncbi:MAG: adaptor protein MecA [Lachnospiraceae bacterium]|nr:adaptor protein MecA [Lachnospiraceae bacterium]